MLVEAPPDVWRWRFGARDANAVPIGLEAAEAYIRDHWREPTPDFVDERVRNGDDATHLDARLWSIFDRWCGPAVT